MSIYQREGQNIWTYDFKYSGHRFSGSTRSANKREARRVLEQKRQEARQEVARAQRSPEHPMTVGEATSLLWTEKLSFVANSADAFRALGWIVGELGAETPLSKVDNRMIATLILTRRSQGVSNATVNRSVAEPLWALFVRAKLIWNQQVQAISWKDHFLPEPQERVREASAEEEAKLRSAIRDDYVPVFNFALLTGCRLSEIVGLTWDKVDFERRELTIVGKGNRTHTIPMTRANFDLLHPLRKDHETAVFTYLAVKTRDGRIKGKRYPITNSGLQTQWKRAKKERLRARFPLS